MITEEHEGRLNDIEEIIKNLVRVGKVVGRDPKKAQCRVEFKDNDGIVSYWCQVLVPMTHKSKYYHLPAINDMVICIFLPYGQDVGFLLGSTYNDDDIIPDGADKEKIIVEDYGNNRDELDAEQQKHTAKSKKHDYYGDFEIFGTLTVNGNTIINGTIRDNMGDLTHHTNGGYPRDVNP
jgi:phage baseplate assembly protein gpV